MLCVRMVCKAVFIVWFCFAMHHPLPQLSIPLTHFYLKGYCFQQTLVVGYLFICCLGGPLRGGISLSIKLELTCQHVGSKDVDVSACGQ